MSRLDSLTHKPQAFGIRRDPRRFVDKCHALGLAVHYWTIDDPSETRRLVDLGADGIMTNDPDIASCVVGPSIPLSSEIETKTTLTCMAEPTP